MLRLYLDTVLIGHKLCSMISTLNEIGLQKKWEHFMTNNVFAEKSKTQQQQNNNRKHKNPCQTHELNPRPLAPQSPLGYGDN